LIDRVRQDVQAIRPLLVDAARYLEPLATLLVLDDDAAAAVDSLRERLRYLAEDRRGFIATLEAQQGSLDETTQRELAALLEHLRKIREDAGSIVRDIDAALDTASGERVTLNWIDRYRSTLRGTKHKVFARAFDTRRRDVLERYGVLRRQMTRLLTTLVLAGDSLAVDRERHFQDFGFTLRATSTYRMPQYIVFLTFAAVFLLSLVISLAYAFGYELFRETGRALFDITTSLSADPLGRAWLSVYLEPTESPHQALLWAVIAALMHMFAVVLALGAWHLAASDAARAERRHRHSAVVIDTWFTGFVFGFVGSVLLFYLMGLARSTLQLADGGTAGMTMVRAAYQWTLLGGITGGFLLVQGIHARRHDDRAAYLTAFLQGIVSAVAAMLIAWFWGYGKVAQEVLAAFALYAGLNALLAGWLLGLLARFFMQIEEVELPDRAGETTPPVGAGT
jgi:hypothetical protein